MFWLLQSGKPETSHSQHQLGRNPHWKQIYTSAQLRHMRAAPQADCHGREVRESWETTSVDHPPTPPPLHSTSLHSTPPMQNLLLFLPPVFIAALHHHQATGLSSAVEKSLQKEEPASHSRLQWRWALDRSDPEPWHAPVERGVARERLAADPPGPGAVFFKPLNYKYTHTHKPWQKYAWGMSAKSFLHLVHSINIPSVANVFF